jgi:uncharacterized protein (TIGR02145 family)
MVENLKTTKFNDGTIIPNVTDNATWAALTTGAYCDNNNDPVMSTTYGKLYNYYAVVDVHQLCPTGWHVPTDDEWETLVSDYLGNIFFSGGKLKEAGTTHWIYNYGATNESGFTALPGGDRSYDGTFFDVGISGHWWTVTEFIPISAGQIYLNSGSTRAYWGDDYKANKKNALSVRCIKD